MSPAGRFVGAGVGEDVEELTDGLLCADGFGQGQAGLELVGFASAVLGLDHAAAGGLFGDDPGAAAPTDAHGGGDVAQAHTGVMGDTDRHPSMVGWSCPALVDHLVRQTGARPMHRGDVKVFVALGGKFALATPDPPYTFEALRDCRLTVQVSTKLNRSHLAHGHRVLILSRLGRTEKDRQASGE